MGLVAGLSAAWQFGLNHFGLFSTAGWARGVKDGARLRCGRESGSYSGRSLCGLRVGDFAVRGLGRVIRVNLDERLKIASANLGVDRSSVT